MEQVLNFDRVMTAGAVVIVGLGAGAYLTYRSIRAMMRKLKKKKV